LQWQHLGSCLNMHQLWFGLHRLLFCCVPFRFVTLCFWAEAVELLRAASSIKMELLSMMHGIEMTRKGGWSWIYLRSSKVYCEWTFFIFSLLICFLIFQKQTNH
jgi:hypothetical protein